MDIKDNRLHFTHPEAALLGLAVDVLDVDSAEMVLTKTQGLLKARNDAKDNVTAMTPLRSVQMELTRRFVSDLEVLGAIQDQLCGLGQAALTEEVERFLGATE
jgi:hypothetical protein